MSYGSRSLVQWNLSIPDALGTTKSVQYIGPGVLISEVDLYTFIVIGTQASVHYIEDVLISGVSTVRGSTVCCLLPHGHHSSSTGSTSAGSKLHTCINQVGSCPTLWNGNT